MMQNKNSTHQWIAGSLLCGALGFSACVTAQPPVRSLSQAELAVRQASESNASQYAPMELQSAREKLDDARLALRAQDYQRASHLAEQALADARLAESRAAVESSRQTARDLRLTIEALRDEVVRASTTNVAHIPSSTPIELQIARERLEEARVAFSMREYQRAHRLAEHAVEDARVAEVRAGTESTRRLARDVRLNSEVLRDETARVSTPSTVVYLPSSPPVELQLAREALASARLALDMREYERARRLAEQAIEDSRVAEMRANTETMRQTARDVYLSSEVVREEAARLAALY